MATRKKALLEKFFETLDLKVCISSDYDFDLTFSGIG